jgi:general secretion pathway protein F
MPRFDYRAANAQGARLTGVENAPSAALAERALRDRGLFPFEITAEGAVSEAAADGRDAAGRGWRWPRLRSRRADATHATRYLATLLSAGFPIDRALRSAARVTGSPEVRRAVDTVRLRVRAGVSLGDALAEHPALFSPFAVGMTRAGERGGTLGSALFQLAQQLERDQALRSRITTALLYPAAMLAVGVAAVAVLVLAVLPRLVALLAAAGATVPGFAASLIAGGAFVVRWWPLGLLAVAAPVLGLTSYRRSPTGARALDALLVRLPVVGPLRRAHAAVRLGRTLGALLESGLSTLPALDVTAQTLTDQAAVAATRLARERVQAGSALAPALAAGGLYPPSFVELVAVGEDSGRLAEMLERGATAAEVELERGLDRVVRVAEPSMILLFFAAVGFTVVALLRAL